MKLLKKQAPVNKGIEAIDYSVEYALDRESIHDIYPFSFEFYPTYTQSGENFLRVLAIVQYPNKAYGNWLSELRRKKESISIIQFIEGSSTDAMIKYYENTISNKEAELMKYNDPIKKKVIERDLQSANKQLDKYMDDKITFVYQHTYIYIRAKSLRELDSLTDNIKNTLTKLRLKAITPTKATRPAFWSALPISENLLKEYTYQESNTDTASSMIPFDNGEILELTATSEIKGINRDTGSLIATDMQNKRKALNQNIVVVGTSGVGKTTFLIQQICRYVAMGYVIFIIDPQNEYSNIIKMLGGEVLHLSSNAKHKINPLQIYSDVLADDEDEAGEIHVVRVTDMERLVKDKIQRFKGLLEVIKNDITQVEKAIMDDVVKRAYVKRGVLKYHSLDELKPDQFPILSDVVNEMELLRESDPAQYERIQDLCYILKSYTLGSNTLFNGYTNVNLTSDLISFDLKPLQNEKELQEAAYLNTFQFLRDEITRDKKRVKKLFVDEFHFLSRHEQGATFFYEAYKTFRKFNAGAIAGTQQIQDVLEGHIVDGINIGEAIVGNSYTQIFFGLDNKGVDDVIEKLRLNFSDKEKKLLSKRKRGEALIRYGSQRAFMKVELTEEELRLINPAEYEDKYKRIPFEKPDYEERIHMSRREQQELKQLIKLA